MIRIHPKKKPDLKNEGCALPAYLAAAIRYSGGSRRSDARATALTPDPRKPRGAER